MKAKIRKHSWFPYGSAAWVRVHLVSFAIRAGQVGEETLDRYAKGHGDLEAVDLPFARIARAEIKRRQRLEAT